MLLTPRCPEFCDPLDSSILLKEPVVKELISLLGRRRSDFPSVLKPKVALEIVPRSTYVDRFVTDEFHWPLAGDALQPEFGA